MGYNGVRRTLFDGCVRHSPKPPPSSAAVVKTFCDREPGLVAWVGVPALAGLWGKRTEYEARRIDFAAPIHRKGPLKSGTCARGLGSGQGQECPCSFLGAVVAPAQLQSGIAAFRRSLGLSQSAARDRLKAGPNLRRGQAGNPFWFERRV